jgi:hypothetical protein
MPSNNWGPFSTAPSAVANYLATPIPAPIAPQSPSGSVTGQSATFNFNSSITSTQERLQNVLQVRSGPAGQPAQNAPQTFSSTWAQGNSYKWA